MTNLDDGTPLNWQKIFSRTPDSLSESERRAAVSMCQKMLLNSSEPMRPVILEKIEQLRSFEIQQIQKHQNELLSEIGKLTAEQAKSAQLSSEAAERQARSSFWVNVFIGVFTGVNALAAAIMAYAAWVGIHSPFQK